MTLPLLKPVIVPVLVLGSRVVSAPVEVMMLFSGSGFDIGRGTGWGGPHQSALTAGLWAYMTAFVRPDMRMGLAASASLILGLISMLISGIIFKVVRVERVWRLWSRRLLKGAAFFFWVDGATYRAQ